MDWGIIAEATFFLAIALLAVVITIFVFASSLLGRAVEMTHRVEEQHKAIQIDEQRRRIEKAKKELDSLEKTSGMDPSKIEQVEKALNDLRKQHEKYDKEYKAIQRGFSVFTVEGGVIRPSFYLLSSIILCGVAWGLSESNVPITILLWVLSLVAIGFGVHRLYFSLKKIQDVAITSEEAALIRTVEAFKVAEKEIEAEKKPSLALMFTDPKPPISIQEGQETELSYDIFLTGGDLARDVIFTLVAPEGFEFTGQGEIGRQTEKADLYPNCPRYRYTIEKVLPKMIYHESVTIRAPSEKGNYQLIYVLQCEGFTSDFVEFNVEVTS